MEPKYSIDPSESLAILEVTSGIMQAAKLAQLLSRETRVRVLAMSPAQAGSITLLIAGQLVEVRHGMDLGTEAGFISDSTCFARPEPGLARLLIQSILGKDEPVIARQHAARNEPSLPLFEPHEQNGTSGHGNATRHSTGRGGVNGGAAPLIASNGQAAGSTKPSSQPLRSSERSVATRNVSDLESLPVHKLRNYVRTIENFPISGRAISRANKSELLQMVKSTEERRQTLEAVRLQTAKVSAREEMSDQ